MIKLNQAIQHVVSGNEPFAVCLARTDRDYDTSDEYGYISDNEHGVATISTARGEISLSSSTAQFEDGEVVLIFPKQNRLHRFFRPSANANTILLTEECDQLCLMCSQPPKNKRYDHFKLYKDALGLIRGPAVVGITGGEPTLLRKTFFPFLREIVDEAPDLSFHILTNGQHFEEEDISFLEELRDKILWGIPLYAPDANVHDEIVGKEGAYKQLFKNLNRLFVAGASIELRTVVLAQNASLLPQLAELASTHLHWISFWAIMQLENYGFAKMNWDNIFVDTSEDFAAVRRALAIAQAHGLDTVLYNFPLCTVPESHRHLARSSISDWKRKFLDACDPCSSQMDCSGLFEWHSDKHGFRYIKAIVQ